MPTTVYGDISPRTAAYASKELLERANPLLVLERFGQAKPLPENPPRPSNSAVTTLSIPRRIR